MTHPGGGSGGSGPGGGGGTGPGREIQTFQFGDLPLRTVMVGGEPWFVVADACRALDLTNPSMAASRLDPDDLSTAEVIDGMGRRQTARVTNESGLYELIFQSRKPEAKAFKRWITHEVLPSIRRTGSYTAPAAELDELEVARRYVLALEAKKAIERELAIAAPKAQSWDTLASANGDLSVADAAKVLNRDPAITTGQQRMFAYLADQGWIFRNRVDGRWRAYQRAVDARWLSELPQHHYDRETGEMVLDPPQIRVTVKGLHRLHHLLGGTAPLRVHEQIALPAP